MDIKWPLPSKAYLDQGRHAEDKMLHSIAALLLLLLGLAHSETPPGFTPEAAAHLDVIFGTKAVSPPGMSLTKAGNSALYHAF